MKRYAALIKLKPEKITEYKILHQAVWPQVLETLSRNDIKNYSIFIKDDLLFSYLEYHGENYEEAMKTIAEDEMTQKWWLLTNPCQVPLASRKADEWWSSMEEVFHME